jgi:hypothetical protein
MTLSTLVPPVPEKAVLDSGCTSTLITSSTPCHNKTPTAHGLRVSIPNGHIMQASHTATLHLPHLPVSFTASARAASVQPELRKSLVSLGQLCDHGCDYVLLDRQYASVIKDGVTTVIGLRDPTNGLWLVDLSPSGTPTPLPLPHPTYEHRANSAYEQKNKIQLIDFLHRACFSPPISTWTKAIDNNFFTTWPGLTSDAVRKFLPKSLATAKGHLKTSPKNLRSTTKVSSPSAVTPPSTVMTTPPSSPEPPVRTHFVYPKVIDITGKIFSDQTGRFPVTSSRGNKYIMIVYDYDSTAILAEPLKNRTEGELVRAYSRIHDYLTARGLKPQLQKLDNECPAALKKFMRAENVAFQLVPPYDHRQNAAERAIGIWKDHFVAGLASLDPEFPMHLWCRLIDQCTQTLNLMRPSRINPRLSAEAQLNGAFDYNKTPLAPPGTKVLVHETPNKRRTWAVHGVDGWYLGGAPEHYRCYRVYASKTRAERIARTVEFFPHYGKMPALSSADAAVRAAIDLCWALRNPSPSSPLAGIGDDQLVAIQQLSDIFNSLAPSEPDPIAPPRVLVNNPPVSRPRVTPASPRVSPASPDPVGPHLIPLDDGSPAALAPTLLRRSPRIHSSAPHVIPPDSSAYHAPHTPPAAHAVIHDTTGQAMNYRFLSAGPDRELWLRSMANDLGRLAQGIGQDRPVDQRVEGTNTIFFIAPTAVPKGRQVTYCKQEATIRPTKAETHRVRNCAGGDRLDFPGPTSTQTASLTTIKILLNSTISTAGARFSAFDIKNFYYGTPMSRYEYMKLHLSKIPDEVIHEYDLRSLANPDGWVYMEIRKGMPGLKQAGRIANDRLTTHLAKFGYRPVPRTPSLWRHDTRPIAFSLVVDDFGVKYVGKQHATHLLESLRHLYTVTEDWAGTLFNGLTITWDYPAGHVDISMPNYLPAVFHRFQHPVPAQHQGAPHAWTVPTYGAKVQYATPPDPAPVLASADITDIQQKVGSLLYYAVGVDPFLRVALGTIASEQSKATKHTQAACQWVMDYAASNPLSIIRYHASDMCLYLHSDASYLSETRARSRAAGHFFLSSTPVDPATPPSGIPTLNGPIHTLCTIIDVIVGSAAEAEIGAGYLNAQDAVPIRTTLLELGHPQPPTPIQVDNTTSDGFANGTMKQKRSKAMDMRWYWLKDRVRQGQFLVYYRPGKTNLADPFTKHHPPSHITDIKPKFCRTSHAPDLPLIPPLLPHPVRGCVNSGPRPVSVRPRILRARAPTRPCTPHISPHRASTVNDRIVCPRILRARAPTRLCTPHIPPHRASTVNDRIVCGQANPVLRQGRIVNQQQQQQRSTVAH